MRYGRIELIRALARVERGPAVRENLLTDLSVVIQVGPVGCELDDHTTSRLPHISGHFDQPCSLGIRVTFAERGVLAMPFVPLPTTTAGSSPPAGSGNGSTTSWRIRTSRF